MVESKGSTSGNSTDNYSDDRSSTLVDCDRRQTVDDSEVAEMKETMNSKEGTCVANLLLSKGFVLSRHYTGLYALFPPHSQGPIYFSSVEDFYNKFNGLDVNDVVAIFPDYKDVLVGMEGCEIERGMVGKVSGVVSEEPPRAETGGVLEEPPRVNEEIGSGGVLDEPPRVKEEIGSGGVLEEPSRVKEETGSGGVLEEPPRVKEEIGSGVPLSSSTVMGINTVLSKLFEEGAVIVVPQGKGKRKLILNSVEQVLEWGSRENTNSNKVGEKRKRDTFSQGEKEGEVTDIPVPIPHCIRFSHPIVQMVFTWLKERDALSLKISKNLESIVKDSKSLDYFKHKVEEALQPLNVAGGVVVSSVSEYNIVKEFLDSHVTIYCQHNHRKKQEIRTAVLADNRSFSTFRD